MPESTYKRIDRAVYQAERALVVVSLIVMALVVFLDVVHRNFSGDDSRFAKVVAKLASYGGVTIAEDSSTYQTLGDIAPWVLFFGFTALAYFGIRSTKRVTPIPQLTALIGAVAGVLVSYGLVRLLLVLLPNGLVWSQPAALVLTLWVGFIGASMCTHESRHLKVEAVQRFIPARHKPLLGFISGLVTTLVCVMLVWLSVRYILFAHNEHLSTGRYVINGTELPKYMAFSALPVAFTFMSVRFFVKSLAALRGEVEEAPDLVEGMGGAPILDEEGRMPSEVATEALPRSSSDDAQSAIETMTSKANELRKRKQVDTSLPSTVPTDAHEVVPSSASGQMGSWDEDDDDIPADLVETRELAEAPIPIPDDTKELRVPASVQAAMEAAVREAESKSRSRLFRGKKTTPKASRKASRDGDDEEESP